MKPELESLYGDVRMLGSGFIEGGDILMTEREILVGRSARTDAEGVAALSAIASDYGWPVREVETPPGVLHFKTDCSLMDAETILCTRRLAASGCFDGYRLLHTAEGEEASANAIRFNDLVVFPAGFPRTRDMLTAEGYTVREIGNSEAAKLDGGMSCLSLRFSPPTG
jgi:dimethylargininase